VNANTTAGSYCNTFTTAYGTLSSQTSATACVTVASSSIGDTVWRDWNGNGVQDAGEEGAPGIVVTLTNSSGVAITRLTDAAGGYLFNGLGAGTYTVTVGAPSGYVQTNDPDNASPFNSATYVLGNSTIITTADFGLQPGGVGVIGNQVFNDVGNDGAFNGPDVNIPNVTVFLYEDTNGNGVIDSGDVKILTTTTNASGLYTFTNLATGLSYIPRVDNTDPAIAAFLSNPSYIATTPIPFSGPDPPAPPRSARAPAALTAWTEPRWSTRSNSSSRRAAARAAVAFARHAAGCSAARGPASAARCASRWNDAASDGADSADLTPAGRRARSALPAARGAQRLWCRGADGPPRSDDPERAASVDRARRRACAGRSAEGQRQE